MHRVTKSELKSAIKGQLRSLTSMAIESRTWFPSDQCRVLVLRGTISKSQWLKDC